MSWSLLATIANPASACGGFACSAVQPVVQESEQVVFEIDESSGEVEMHVQIAYSGPSSDFSWIVPVPASPEIEVGTSALFTAIEIATRPTFLLETLEHGKCHGNVDLSPGCAEYSMGMSAPMSPNMLEDASTVDVAARQNVGPYETVTLSAESAEGLMTWLEDNGYDLPSNLESVLEPYVSSGSQFVALKLRKDRDAGDIVPLVLRYQADKAIIPVQLTSISAAPDVPLQVYVLSKTRAVPESYLHVRINEAAIDWWTLGALFDEMGMPLGTVNGVNYPDVVSLAADEAGGHAFATDYYGDSDVVQPIWDESSYDRLKMIGATDYELWLEAARPAFLTVPPELLVAIESLLGLSAGEGFIAWQSPYAVDYPRPFDAVALTESFEELVVEPMRRAQELLDSNPKLTRMSSSLSAVEMTVDPTFVLNADMDSPVSNVHDAKLFYECGSGRNRDKAPRTLLLADGTEIALPSDRWIRDQGTTDAQYLADRVGSRASLIEQTGNSGLPEILADLRSEISEQASSFEGQGCGCQSDLRGGLMLPVALLALLRRRTGR